MDQTNPGTTPPPPASPISPQPLNTGPTEMPMGVPMQPAGGVSQGLPADLPPAGAVKSSGGSNKMIMMVVIILVIIAALGAGGYYFYSMQNQGEAPQEDTASVESDPELEQLQIETAEIDLQDPQEEITQITTEINLLEASPAPSASSSARPRP